MNGFSKKHVLAVMVAAALALNGCSGADTPQEHIHNAQKALEKHDNKIAIIELKNALQKEPANAEARRMLGTIYADMGDALSAEKELREALKLGENKADLLAALGQSLLMQGKFKEVLDEIVPDNTHNAETASTLVTLRGSAHLALGQRYQAKASYEQALAKFQGNADANLGLARLSAIGNDIPGAYQQIELALKTDTKKTEALQLRGDLLRYQGKNDQALASYRQIISIDDKNIPARLSIVGVLMATDKLDEARKEIETAERKASKNLAVKITRASLDYRQKRYSAAQDALQEVLRFNPDHLQSLMLAGMVEFAMGSYEQAETRFNRVLVLAPENLFAKKRQAALMLKRNQLDQGIKKLNELLAASPKDPEILALLGQASMSKGQYAKAADYYEKVTELAPKSASIRAELAVSRLASGETREGMADLEKAAGMDPTLTQADALLIINHLRLKEYDKALTAALEAEKKQPKNPLFQNLKGGAYMAKQDVPNARKSFEQALVLDPAFMPAAVNLAKLDVMEKKPDQARKRFDGVLKKDKNNLQAMLELAALAKAQAKDGEAIQWLEKAVAAHPDAVKPRTLLVGGYLQNKQPKKALQSAKEALSAHPDSLFALDLVGSAQLANNLVDEAIGTYSKMAETSPASPVSYLKLAGAYSQKQDVASVRRSLVKALQLKPDYLDADIAMLQLEAQQKRYDEALKIARNMQQKYPKLQIGHAFEGDVLLTQNKPLLAAKAYESALARANNTELAIKIAAAYARGGQTQKGENALLQRIRATPSDIAARNYLGTVYMAQGKDKEAVSQYQAVVKLAPNHSMALNNLAWLSQQLKDPQAVSYAQRAYKLEPENASVIDTLAWIYVHNNKLGEGLALYKKALKLAPGVAEIQYHYAVALHKSGDKAGARAQLKAALDSGKPFTGIEEARALQKQL